MQNIFSKLAVLLFSIIIWSSANISHASQIIRLAPAEGLSQSYVNTLILDKKGFLWLATEGGLNRYDGYQVLTVKGPQGVLDEEMIDAMYQDPQGRIWITSRSFGLYSYDPQQDTFRKYMSLPRSEEESLLFGVNSMLSKNADQLWLARGDNVSLLDINSGQINIEIPLPIDKEMGFVRALMAVGDYLFIASSQGTFVYHEKLKKLILIKHIDNENHEFQLHTKSLALLDPETLLIGAVKGLYKVDISQLEKKFEYEDNRWEYETLISDLNIWKIVPKSDNVVLGTDKGLMYLDTDSKQVVRDQRIAQSQYSLTDTTIVDFIEDQQGALWVATKMDGAFYLPKKQSSFINVNSLTVKGEGFSHSNVWDLQAYDGKIWAATNDGLTCYNPPTGKTANYLKGYLGEAIQPEFSVYRMLLYRDEFWLLTNRGLFAFNPKTHDIRRPLVKGSQYQEVMQGPVFGTALLQTGELYFVNSDEGFFHYDIESQTLLKLAGDLQTQDPFLSMGFTKPLSDKPDQPLYFYGGVLYRFKLKTQTLEKVYAIPNANEHSPDNVLTYTIDKNNILWLALSNMGLIGLTLEGYEVAHTIDLRQLKLETPMYEMHQDKAGMIWMSSHKGIWRLDPDNLHMQQFTTKDGLYSNEFNWGASDQLQDGSLVYGSLKGFTWFDPAVNRPKKPLLSRVNITSVELMSRKLDINGLKEIEYLELNHDDIGLEVAFSAMIFDFKDRVVYEYQISGGQKTLTRSNNRVVFPKLNPGNYQLKVWAKDPFTGDYTEPAKLNINVKYPYWRSPMALGVYILFALLSFSLWMYRKNKVEQMIIAAHKETQNSEARLKLALESSGSGVWDWQLDNHLIYQPRLTTELDYPHDNVTLDEYLKIIHPNDRALFRIEWLEFVSTNKGTFNCTYRLQHKQGYWRWYKDYGKVIAWRETIPERVTGTYTNLTRERIFEERARLFGAAFEQTRDWVFILDKNMRIQACNTALQQAFQIEAKPESSTKLHLGLSRQARMSYLRAMTLLKPGEHYSAEERLTQPSGEVCFVLIKVSAVAGSNGELENYVVVMTDISSQKRTEQELYQLANYDVVTQLPNKVLFIDRVQHALSQGQNHAPVMVVALRFKRLKRYQEALSAEQYTATVRHLVSIIRQCFREQDSIGVEGAHEFYILMEQAKDVSEVTRCISEIMQHFDKPITINGHDLSLDVCFGVAYSPEDGVEAFSLCQNAKLALSHAMHQPHTGVHFFKQEMNKQVQRSFLLEKDLRRAIENGDFSNSYQPIISGTSKTIDGFEVSINWPNYLQCDAKDIEKSVAQTGLCSSIMLLTLERALIELKQWHGHNNELYVALNLSALDFQNPQLISQIRSVLTRTGVTGRYVAFEITESIMMSDIPCVIETMYQLKVLGCRLFMDDFGTGYASLTYLKQFPIDVLKIDRSFVADIGIDNEHEVIVHASLSLAHSLGMQCIAEGITTPEQLRFLRMLGCDYFQGPLFCEPQLGEHINELCEKNWQPVFSSI
ncbi:EAL domain-containing protein [Pseudoalteromonas sp. JBTF-M23]|uniref:EAL domain-containing protein n=1 Tax=Pseudoalteromonas caenipelagi TaxID=2726988 RepID=A0A849VJH9_9GAMM|nr:EAL domain-containing protein [Pseudoalteromonas caenipelagi]NOU52613.1 EAL domain-containing protein [Pseudoalteromonas caenipelagi]